MKLRLRTWLCTVLCSTLLGTSAFGNEGGRKWKDAPVEVVITPYVWLPWVNGTFSIDKTLKDVQADVAATPVDLLRNLRGAAMFHGQLSKGHFVTDVDYIFLLLKSENTLFESASGEDLLLSGAKITGHVIEYTLGGRIKRGIVVFDPYAGLRYTFLKTQADLTTPSKSREGSVNMSFFDALFGARLTVYPHPKVPLTVEGDFGGFDGGSRLTWTAEVSAGYQVSRLVDLKAGFKSWGFEYTKKGSDKSMETTFFGFEVGAAFHFPKRKTTSEGDAGSGTDLED